jgi:N-acylneuraminate cytidylyltransferase
MAPQKKKQHTKKILGIIPARGGSKSIPRKNIKSFAGKPLIAWSIAAARDSGIVDRVIVTTDDDEIAAIAKEHGAEIPFLRPKELAEDTTPTLPVLQHAVSFLRESEGYYPEYVLLLEPTSPGRRSFHLTDAVEILEKTGADSVVALGTVPGHHSPFWQFNVKEDNSIELFTGGKITNIIRRRQDLPKTYFRNGAFYLFRTDLLFAPEPSLYGEDVRGYPMDPRYSIDIDSHEDWVIGEALLGAIIKEENQ